MSPRGSENATRPPCFEQKKLSHFTFDLVDSEAYEVLLQEWRFGLNGEQSALAAQLTADIFAKDKKGQWSASEPKEKRRKKKDYIPLAERRVPTLEAGGESRDLAQARTGSIEAEGSAYN